MLQGPVRWRLLPTRRRLRQRPRSAAEKSTGASRLPAVWPLRVLIRHVVRCLLPLRRRGAKLVQENKRRPSLGPPWLQPKAILSVPSWISLGRQKRRPWCGTCPRSKPGARLWSSTCPGQKRTASSCGARQSSFARASRRPPAPAPRLRRWRDALAGSSATARSFRTRSPASRRIATGPRRRGPLRRHWAWHRGTTDTWRARCARPGLPGTKRPAGSRGWRLKSWRLAGSARRCR
mmetsp:Transcript_68161/g.193101  ORF Transcript_68161/g.193101 Transcript_68161/m.193101 type:complete len:235 (+) Transcript_68161:398-1102(+)